MPVRLLANDGKELKLRIEGEGSSTLQMFRSRLNDHPDVEYANFFTGHPDLDDPELYLRVKDGKDASKLITELCNTIVGLLASRFNPLGDRLIDRKQVEARLGLDYFCVEEGIGEFSKPS